MNMCGGILIGTLVAAVYCTDSLAFDDLSKPKKCEAGHSLERHTPPGGFDFVTEYWERAYNNAFAYYACVENDESSGRDLFVYWHIPGVLSILPKLDSSTVPRVFPDHPTRTIRGCLIYGNNRDVMMVDFFGHQDEVALAALEGDCQALRPQPRPASASLKGFPGFDADGRMIFPTDILDIANSLIRFVYEIGLKQAGGNYTMTLSYVAAPVDREHFKGDLSNVRIRPSDERLATSWEQAGLSKPLTENSRTFQLTLPLPANYAMVQQTYRLIDPKGSLLGEIPAPFLTEAIQR
jgi:hypothetical protein